MGKRFQYSPRVVRLALMAYAEGVELDDIASMFGMYAGNGAFHVLEPYRKKYGLTQGGGLPPELAALFRVERTEPEHERANKRMRRGFSLPHHKENSYIDLLKTGLSISEARAAVGAV